MTVYFSCFLIKKSKHAVPKQNYITHRRLFQEIYLECKCFGLLFSSKFGENACLKEYEICCYMDVFKVCSFAMQFFKGCFFLIIFLEFRTYIGPIDD